MTYTIRNSKKTTKGTNRFTSQNYYNLTHDLLLYQFIQITINKLTTHYNSSNVVSYFIITVKLLTEEKIDCFRRNTCQISLSIFLQLNLYSHLLLHNHKN